MILKILRGIFIVLVAAVSALYALTWQAQTQNTGQTYSLSLPRTILIIMLGMGFAAVIVAVDYFTPRKKLSALSGVFLGLLVGLLVAFAFGKVVDLFGLITAPEVQETARDAYYTLLEGVKVLIGLVTCYLGMSLVIQTKDDFRFVIPYVEFAKELRGLRPTIVDTSVIIDGRIIDLVRTQFLPGALFVPKFVIQELHALADSADKMKRAKGRRGWTCCKSCRRRRGRR